MAIRIREAVEEDAQAVAALLGELGYPCAPEQALARMRRLAESREQTLLVAELEGVAGLAAYRIEQAIELERPLCRLTALVVGEARRGRGVGRALVEAVEATARARGCERLTLSSGSWRPEAHSFYEALGFEETGRRFARRLS